METTNIRWTTFLSETNVNILKNMWQKVVQFFPEFFSFEEYNHTPPCGRLADRNCNRNLKPQLDNRNTEHEIKMF